MMTYEKTIHSTSHAVLELWPVEIFTTRWRFIMRSLFFADRPMQICLYVYKYSTYIHKHWFLDLLKVTESKFAVRIAEKHLFHVENKGWQFCNKVFSSKLWPRNVSCRCNIANNCLLIFAALHLYFVLIQVWWCFSKFLKKLRFKLYTFHPKKQHFANIQNHIHVIVIMM